MQTNWVYRSEALRFCKNDSDSSLELSIVTRVESFCEKRDSSRVESPSFSTWLESSHIHQNRDLSHAITGNCSYDKDYILGLADLLCHITKNPYPNCKPVFGFQNLLNDDKVSIWCALLAPQWKQSLGSTSVQVGESWSLKSSIAWQAKQKTSANLDHHWSKKCLFLCVQTNWVCPSGFQRFSKNDSDSSWVILCETWLELSPNHQISWLESLPNNQISWLESSWVIDSSHAIIGQWGGWSQTKCNA